MAEAEQLKLATKRSLQQTHISQASGSGEDEGTGTIAGVPDVPTEESDEEISWKSSDEGEDDDDDDEGSDDQSDDDAHDDDDDEDELYRDVNINLEGRVVQMADVYTTQEFEDSHVTLTSVNLDGQQQSSSVSSQFTLEDNFSEFIQTNQFAGAVSSILEIVQRYMDQRMNEAVKVAIQIQSDRLRDEAQADNEEFLKNLDENIQKIIKEQVKEQ
nr:hypothetical protein [Tanacetum cinerariifolium]